MIGLGVLGRPYSCYCLCAATGITELVREGAVYSLGIDEALSSPRTDYASYPVMASVDVRSNGAEDSEEDVEEWRNDRRKRSKVRRLLRPLRPALCPSYVCRAPIKTDTAHIHSVLALDCLHVIGLGCMDDRYIMETWMLHFRVHTSSFCHVIRIFFFFFRRVT